MDCHENIKELWEWQGDDYLLHKDPYESTDFSHMLWDSVTPEEDNLLYTLDGQTPIKDCTEYGFDATSTENVNKISEECIESSQAKRRRMLQYDSNATEISFGGQHFQPNVIQPKVRDELLLDDALHDNMQWIPGFSDRSCRNGEGQMRLSSPKWAMTSTSNVEMGFGCDEMIATDCEIDISDFCNIPPDTEPDEVPKITKSSSRIKFKALGRTQIETPVKSATSIAYPFTIIKPSGVQGDITLKHINQRIQTPLKAKSKKDENPFHCYPTSAFSGKPVVSKTKICTEGGKGSITIMRTKG